MSSADKLNAETKMRIDKLSIIQLLEAQRFAPIGDPKFQGEEGRYRMDRLAKLRDEDNDAYVRASKDLSS